MMATKNPFQGDDKDPFSAVRDKDGGIKKQTFGQAFAAARRAGKKTFTHNGKSFTTETKDDVNKRAAAKKRDDAAFAKEDARSKTARAVAGDSDNRQRDAEDRRRMAPIAAQGQRDRMANQTRAARARNVNVAATRKRMQDDIDTAAAKRKVSGFAAGGKVRGAGIAKKGFGKCKIV
jgi:hypothetical protein